MDEIDEDAKQVGAGFHHEKPTYDWVVYSRDGTMHTVRRTETVDVAKVASLGAALRLIETLKKADEAP